MKKILLFLPLIMMLFTASCGNKAGVAESSENSLPSEDSVEVLLEKSIEERVNADPKLAELRAAGMKMSEYLRLEGDKYVIDLTEEAAAELGISTEAYQYQINELNKANEMIATAKANGDSIELLDIQKLLTEGNKQTHHHRESLLRR